MELSNPLISMFEGPRKSEGAKAACSITEYYNEAYPFGCGISALFRSTPWQEVEWSSLWELKRWWWWWYCGGGYSKVCVGVTLGSDDLINIPACEANLLHSEGCSCDGTTHEGDIGEQAGGVETHP